MKIVCINYVWTSVLIRDEVVKPAVIRADTVHSQDDKQWQENSEVY